MQKLRPYVLPGLFVFHLVVLCVMLAIISPRSNTGKTTTLQVTPEHYVQAVAQGGANGGAVVAQMGVPQAAAPDRRQSHQTKRAPGLNTPNGVFPEASKTVEAPRKEPSS